MKRLIMLALAGMMAVMISACGEDAKAPSDIMPATETSAPAAEAAAPAAEEAPAPAPAAEAAAPAAEAPAA